MTKAEGRSSEKTNDVIRMLEVLASPAAREEKKARDGVQSHAVNKSVSHTCAMKHQ